MPVLVRCVGRHSDALHVGYFLTCACATSFALVADVHAFLPFLRAGMRGYSSKLSFVRYDASSLCCVFLLVGQQSLSKCGIGVRCESGELLECFATHTSRARQSSVSEAFVLRTKEGRDRCEETKTRKRHRRDGDFTHQRMVVP